MTCCAIPDVGNAWAVPFDGGWAVLSTCRTCGSPRRESQVFDDEATARQFLRELRLGRATYQPREEAHPERRTP